MKANVFFRKPFFFIGSPTLTFDLLLVSHFSDVKILLYMCLAVDPTLRSTLEELKNSRFLNNLALCLPSVTW